jgi:hypothetical protein
MRLTVRQLKRIIKEAVSVEKRAAYNQRRREKAAAGRARAEQERISALNMPPEKEEKIARFIEDIHGEFGNVGEEGGSVSWDEVMDFARQKGVKTTPDELERVFNHSDMLDSGLPYIMHVTDSGFDFEDPMAL